MEEATDFVASFVVNQNNTSLKSQYEKLNLNFLKGDNEKIILEKSLALINIANLQNNNEVIVLTNYLIARIFEKVGSLNKAITYYKKTAYNQKINIDELSDSELKNKSFESHVFFKIASNYQDINKKDSALFYYDKILKSNTLDQESEIIKARAYSNIAGIYLKDGDFNKAQNYSLKAIKLHKQLNSKISASSALGNLASIYLVQEKYNEAKITYDEAINLIKFEKSDRAIKLKEDLYFNYAYTLYKLKDYEAYTYQELSYDIKDSIRESGIEKAVEEIYAMYNVEKVKKEVALKQAEAQKKMWLIILSSGSIIIALVFIAGFYRLRQKNLQLKLSQSQLLQEQKIEKLKSISQKRILNAILDGKETERKEIAETLHDSVSALLSSANLHLQASRNQFNGSAPIEIEKSQKIISEASQKIRNLSHNLVSSILLKFGIEYAVKDLISKYSNTQIKFEAHIETISRYNQNFEIKIHNIIQELVNNILKHSEASMASISIDEHDNKLYILISDNGKGFSIKDIQEKDGLGLNQIEARIQMMSGKFSINSVFDKGTDIEIEIPILSEKLLTSDS